MFRSSTAKESGLLRRQRLRQRSICICLDDHGRQWLVDTCKGTELAVSGAGSSGTELKAKIQVAGSRWDWLLYVTITDPKLVAEFIDTTGKVEFTRTLTK